jgi:thiol peroxidase
MSHRTVSFKGNPVPLEGPELKPGDAAPNFRLQQNAADGLGDVTLDDFAGKTLLISVVPSIDTSVCAQQTRTFNQKAAQLPDNVAVLTVSMDLPFAQARFCGSEHIDRIKVLSDHRTGDFGRAYGLLIAEGPLQRILARAVFVVSPDRKVKYVEYVPEITQEPNYDAALAAVA